MHDRQAKEKVTNLRPYSKESGSWEWDECDVPTVISGLVLAILLTRDGTEKAPTAMATHPIPSEQVTKTKVTNNRTTGVRGTETPRKINITTSGGVTSRNPRVSGLNPRETSPTSHVPNQACKLIMRLLSSVTSM